MKSLLDKVQTIFETATGSVYDIYYVLYKECLLKQENSGVILETILKEAAEKKIEENGCSTYIDDEIIEKTKYLYYNLLGESVTSLIRKNLEHAEFYQTLYHLIFESELFDCDEKMKAVLLYLLAEKIRPFPYYQAINMLEMTGDVYRETVQRLEPEIRKAMYILNRRFQSRTEEASQIYEILSGIENKEDQIVFLSVYTKLVQDFFEKRMKE